MSNLNDTTRHDTNPPTYSECIRNNDKDTQPLIMPSAPQRNYSSMPYSQVIFNVYL